MKKKQDSRKDLLRSSGVMGVATLASRLLGLVREQAMAFLFGAGAGMDAFQVAYRIPNLLRDLFAEGTFSASFVPLFIEADQSSRDESRALLWTTATVIGGITLSMTLPVVFFSQEIILAFAPEFAKRPEQLLMSSTLVKIMSPFLFLVSMAALFMGALNTRKVFFIPALMPACFNIVVISSIFLLRGHISRWLDLPELSVLGPAIVLGGLVQAFFQIPFLFKNQLTPVSLQDFWAPLALTKIKIILKRLALGLGGMAATQVNILGTTIIATSTGVGAVSWLNYAFRLFQFPVGVLSVSLAGGHLVHFGQAWKSGEEEKAKRILSQGFELSASLTLPIMAVAYIWSLDITQLVFQRGAFSSADALATSKVLKAYLIGLPFYGAYKLLAPVFYAIDHPKVPVVISAVCVLSNLVFCFFMAPTHGFVVLAIGTSLSMALNVSAQICFLSRILKQGFIEALGGRVVLIALLSSLLLLPLGELLRTLLISSGGMTFWEQSLKTLVGLSPGPLLAGGLVLLGKKIKKNH